MNDPKGGLLVLGKLNSLLESQPRRRTPVDRYQYSLVTLKFLSAQLACCTDSGSCPRGKPKPDA